MKRTLQRNIIQWIVGFILVLGAALRHVQPDADMRCVSVQMHFLQSRAFHDVPLSKIYARPVDPSATVTVYDQTKRNARSQSKAAELVALQKRHKALLEDGLVQLTTNIFYLFS